MKWSLAGLFGLGFVAAIFAVILVVSMKQQTRAADAGDPTSGSLELKVLVASRSLPAHHVLSVGDITDAAVSSVPTGAYVDAVELVGKVLVTPLSTGQAFRASHFAVRGSNAELAASLPAGKRALQVRLSDDMNAERLLYPGALVDVVANLVIESDNRDESVSLPILQGVLVLAVGSKTVVAPEGNSQAPGSRRGESVITLLVDPDQANYIALAQTEGTLELVLRNPLDESTDQGQEARLGAMLAAFGLEPAGNSARMQLEAEVSDARREITQLRLDLKEALELAEKERLRADAQLAANQAAQQRSPAWTTVVLRGGESSTKTFDRPKAID